MGWVPPGTGSQGPLSLVRESLIQPACLQSKEPFPLAPVRNSPRPSLGICSPDLPGCPLPLLVTFLPKALRLHLQLCTLSLSTLVLVLPRQVALAA